MVRHSVYTFGTMSFLPSANSIRTIRTNGNDLAFHHLVVALDKDLAVRDGDEHTFFSQFNKLNDIHHVVLALDSDCAIGCGAFKPFAEGAVEIKRMYTRPTHRNCGVGTLVLTELERWAAELGHARCVLETGRKMTEAIALYEKRGYTATPNYGQYIGVESSVCFEKCL